ncbi:diguanylate cyclase domain-containing protein [Solibacillus sp. FSL H8-0538]|uniref:diguanylate cyclase domain-containing protein n=1 Tax=Solibacillus sp. FSL H8-0538 TaxID=2921400 RepID=UPI0030FD0A0A
MVTYDSLKKAKKENLILFHSLFEDNSDAIFVLNEAGYILDGNMALEKMSGFLLSELQGTHFLSLIDEAERKEAEEQLFGTHTIYQDNRFNLISSEDRKIGCLMKVVPMKQDEQIQGYFLVVKDMRELDKRAQHYLESELSFRIITENVQDVIMLMDANKEYLYVSPSSKQMFGLAYEDILKKEAFFNIHPDYVAELVEKFEQAIQDGQPYIVILKVLHGDGGWVWTEINGKPVFSDDLQFRHMLLVARDISKQKESEEKLKFLAYHDALTGLPNRRLFSKHLSEALVLLKELDQCFAVMLLDIDNFKMINDCYGHEIGDKVIEEFGHRLQKIMGGFGVAARLGGDEFIILINQVDSEKSVELFAKRIQQSFEQPVIIQQTAHYITTSIGITLCHKNSLTASMILKSADEALYVVKGQGKNHHAIVTCK